MEWNYFNQQQKKDKHSLHKRKWSLVRSKTVSRTKCYFRTAFTCYSQLHFVLSWILLKHSLFCTNFHIPYTPAFFSFSFFLSFLRHSYASFGGNSHSVQKRRVLQKKQNKNRKASCVDYEQCGSRNDYAVALDRPKAIKSVDNLEY